MGGSEVCDDGCHAGDHDEDVDQGPEAAADDSDPGMGRAPNLRMGPGQAQALDPQHERRDAQRQTGEGSSENRPM